MQAPALAEAAALEAEMQHNESLVAGASSLKERELGVCMNTSCSSGITPSTMQSGPLLY